MQWKVFLASAAGKHHLDSALPCQDAGHFDIVHDVVIGAVCDGAGSAPEGRAGAEFMARDVVQRLAAAARAGALAPAPGGQWRDTLLPAVQQARQALEALAVAAGRDLRDFACTLVGCVATGDGGVFFHVGDGFGVCVPSSGAAVLSLPENGEYADETYFVSDADWHEHLRTTPLPRVGAGGYIGLMSDGAGPFAIDRARTGFYGPFIDPIVAFLGRSDARDGNPALHGVLASERTWSITTDDKTLLLALAG